MDCIHIKNTYFDPVALDCSAPNAYNTVLNANIGSSLIEPLSSSKEFPIIFDFGSSVVKSKSRLVVWLKGW